MPTPPLPADEQPHPCVWIQSIGRSTPPSDAASSLVLRLRHSRQWQCSPAGGSPGTRRPAGPEPNLHRLEIGNWLLSAEEPRPEADGSDSGVPVDALRSDT